MRSYNSRNSISLRVIAVSLVLIVAGTFTNAKAQDAVVSDFLNVYSTSTDKIAQLADAMPEDSYDWRPQEGVRSVREAVLHVTAGNYFFASMLGMQLPEGVNPQTMEQSGMSKSEAITAMKESVMFIKKELPGMSSDELETKIDFFGNEVTKRQAMFVLGDHAAEHLGQLIAYARMNGVTPPWSQSSQ